MSSLRDEQQLLPAAPAGSDWMWELAMHYEQMRRAYPEDVLCVVFDIAWT